ncbi:TIGR03621 family F420-dependent LLM class oxidoreductase [Actinoplanes missouriensis]|uniref:TIGR03621 family F420-dependent LLM class oxidoreductase n=1 Tax=Actinoplanes missouriensis TaxID=1866 RepID=UPI0033C3C2F3
MSAYEERPFRFGVNLVNPSPLAEWSAKCRKAEDLGYDVLTVPDHLGAPAPFPALVAAAAATERVRLGTYALNTAFHNPVLLARDVAGTDALTGGRLEVGIAAGSIRPGTNSEGVPFPPPGQRVDSLERSVIELRKLLADPAFEPKPTQAGGPPLLIAGNGDRVLRLAAEHADIVGFTGIFQTENPWPKLANPDELGARIDVVNRLLGDRADTVVFNLLIQQVIVTDDPLATARTWADHPLAHFTPEELLACTSWLIGTTEEIAERLRFLRSRLGISYFVVLEPWMEQFAEVMKILR